MYIMTVFNKSTKPIKKVVEKRKPSGNEISSSILVHVGIKRLVRTWRYSRAVHQRTLSRLQDINTAFL